MNDEILRVWKEYNYPNVAKVYSLLNGKYKIKDIDQVLKDQNVKQLFYNKPDNDNGHNLAIGNDHKWQCDLCFMDKFGRTNKGYNYILLVIDVFSRFAWTIPLKTKNVSEVVLAFESIKEYPSLLQSDNGSEFVGAAFQKMLKEHNVIHKTCLVGDHKFLGIVDRFTLTLKNIIYKNFIANDNTVWIDSIDSYVKAYNNTPHNGLDNFTPNEVRNDTTINGLITQYNIEELKKQSKRITDIKEDANVRIQIPKTKFTRGFNPKWSSEVYKIEKREGNKLYINGKKYNIKNIQVVNNDVTNTSHELKKALKEDKVKRALVKEGVDVSNIVTRNKEAKAEPIKWNASLIGRKVKKGKREGEITRYDAEGPYHWFVQFSNGDTEYMSKSELIRYFV